MQQFTVPQFIDVEDKVFGPITIRQFVIILVGAFLIFLSYHTFDFAMFIFATIVIGVGVGIVAFLKINGALFHQFLLNFIQTLKRPSIRVWNNGIGKLDFHIEAAEKNKEENFPATVKKQVNASRLAELSLIVDTQGVYRGETNKNVVNKILNINDEKINQGNNLLSVN